MLDLLVVIYNGIDYYAPIAPKEVALITRNCTAASTHIEDAIELVTKIVNDLPPSNARVSLLKSVKLMRAANSHLEGTLLATGTIALASLPVDVPILKVMASSVVTKMVHKRVATSIGRCHLKNKVPKVKKHLQRERKHIKIMSPNSLHVIQSLLKINVHAQSHSTRWNSFYNISTMPIRMVKHGSVRSVTLSSIVRAIAGHMPVNISDAFSFILTVLIKMKMIAMMPVTPKRRFAKKGSTKY